MKKIITITAVMLLVCSAASAQNVLGRLAERAKNAAENAVGNKIENAINNGIDKATSKKDRNSSKNNDNSNDYYDDAEQQDNAYVNDIQVQKSDFVPGDEIIFDDDFADEQLGEFSSKWDVRSGNAEVATIDGRKVLMCADGGTIVYPLMKNPHGYLSEAFTIEYDFYLGEEDSHVDVGLKFFNPESSLGYWSMDWDGFNWILNKPTDGDTRGNKFWDDAKAEGLFNFNAWNHIAISFNKRAFKAYVNGTRITNVPNMAAPKYVEFEISPNEKNGYNGISNVRIANGAVPLYDRLATDGKIITYAITFETGKADIKPESYVEINRIAKLMQENPNLSFEVQGHCDASGSDKVNDPLSQKRAEAIVAAIVEQGIAESRLSAVGKGSHQPIASNSTDEGRAKNRRVEFIKK